MYHIKLIIFDDTNNCALADVVASCNQLANVPRTLKTLLKTVPITTVTNGTAHPPLDLPPDSDPSQDRTTTPQHKTKRAAAVLTESTRVINLARRNRTYVPPRQHMFDHPLILNQHSDLVGYLNKLSTDIPGVLSMKEEAHRKWFAWYDRGISHGLLSDWCRDNSLTVRAWHAENMMAKLLAYDFAGRELRVEVQRIRAGLLAKRITIPAFDAKMITFTTKLAKLQDPVNAQAH
jgi:hypothetical protein